jgi:hypothetical protein
MFNESIVHISIGPLGDWYYYTCCGTYASSEWITNKLAEATCDLCLHTVIIGDAAQ